ncbi:hypothetical protein M422DRAFT_276431 [Sphaerobolus stellatus SS14]|uniref:DUF6533 domain-containing protein n=1 Tax=Sphaerobolus stellatus (strain SS14) TaxID=990650 RepID=A0A0C9UD82_SPHS4|nr:hypothetical protein M422DRAFT_276431 [Sphaerobolus stellatus SS14]
MPAFPDPPPEPITEDSILHLHAITYFSLAVIVMLFYDHLLTFDEELCRIWRQPFSGATLLFLLNRYLTPSHAIISSIWYLSPALSNTKCFSFTFRSGFVCILIAGKGLHP